MTYVLKNPPRTRNEAYDALDNVFGAEEFTEPEACEVLEEVLDMSSNESRNELHRLIRMDAVGET